MQQVCELVRYNWRPLLDGLIDIPFKGISEVHKKKDNRSVYNTGQGHVLYLELLMTGTII